MFSQLGPLEIVLILVILLVVFGPKRLPGIGRSLGGGLREFKDSITGDDKQHDPDAADRPALTQAQPDAEPAARSTADSAPEQRS